MIVIYILSVLIAYFSAILIWNMRGLEDDKSEKKMYKCMICVLLSSIFIWPFSFLIIMAWYIYLIIKWLAVNAYEMIKDIFNL